MIINIASEKSLETRASIKSPEFEGVPTAPTAEVGTKSDQIATTAFVSSALEAAPPKTVLTTLKASDWPSVGSLYEQTVNVPEMTPKAVGFMGLADTATDAEYEIARAAAIRKTAQGVGTITVRAIGDRPTADLPIKIVIYRLGDTVPCILKATAWTGEAPPYNQTITFEGITLSEEGFIGISDTATDDQFLVATNAQLRRYTQTATSVSIKAYGEKPAVDIPIQVVLP